MVKRISKPNESGQALVLLVLGLVGLLGFTAVAIDGGQLYSQQRRAQNTADNAALAAALKSTQGQNYVAEALSVSLQNGYDNDGAFNWVNVAGPNEGGPTGGTYAGNPNYVEVAITQQVTTSFVHLVYKGPVKLTVRAVARAFLSTPSPIVPGQALVALDEDDCNALNFHGNGTTEITGGGAFSNSNAEPPPASCHSGSASGSSVIFASGGIDTAGSWDSGSATVTGTVTTNVPQLPPDDPALEVDEASLDNLCGALPDNGVHSQNGGSENINAGRYSEIRVLAGGTLTMNPGLYCVTGANGYDTSGGTITGSGVLIYLWTGPFETNGNAANFLTAPTSATCTVPPSTGVEICDFNGLLLYAREGNTSTMLVNGGAGSNMTGTFYAPDAHIEITGNTGTFVLDSQVIGNTVDVGGNGTVDINYNAGNNFANLVPPQIELSE